MRIGIDIDNTLTDVQNKLTQAARLYAESLKKLKNNNINEINDSGNDGSIYQKLFGFSYDELKYFLVFFQQKRPLFYAFSSNHIEYLQPQ